MHRKAIVFLALIAFTSTALLGQRYVISLVHGDANSPHGVHEHIYESWEQLEVSQHAHSHHAFCGCDNHSCFVSVGGDYAEVYSFKVLNELPTTNLVLGELELPLLDFSPIKSTIPHDVNWLFDFVDRLERPPSVKLS